LQIGTTVASADRLFQAVRRNPVYSREGFLEYVFSLAFRGLVYPQIWEDPEVDMEALAITPECHVVAIASGGCNILSYLTADPARITAVDLNRAHVALNRLKLAAAVYLPSWRSFYRFFGDANDTANISAYRRFLAPHLDGETRDYWENRSALRFGRQRISMFAHNLYRHGLLGRFIGVGHAVARVYGVDLREVLRARSIEDQQRLFNATIAPLFEKRLVRWLTARPATLFGLGIPPAQYDALVGNGDMAAVLRERVERLYCGFRVTENYFAWQAFGRSYADRGTGPLPPYLRRDRFDAVRCRAGRVEVLNRSVTEYLESRAAASVDRYVLLDAQDWMTDAQLDALWGEITRTARPGARVIFRTAAALDLLPGRVRSNVLRHWRYNAETSYALTKRDRSAIYGGFHLYVLEG
jgi:S-adenosylmethionine-diacylglycerol 3-amino-3-carboxypropyl transferase